MNNNDLRSEIFSFLRKEPKLICDFCKSICIWDSKVKTYYEIPILPYLQEKMDSFNYKHIMCIDCISEYRFPVCIIT